MSCMARAVGDAWQEVVVPFLAADDRQPVASIETKELS
jgi:hypothetical protein